MELTMDDIRARENNVSDTVVEAGTGRKPRRTLKNGIQSEYDALIEMKQLLIETGIKNTKEYNAMIKSLKKILKKYSKINLKAKQVDPDDKDSVYKGIELKRDKIQIQLDSIVDIRKSQGLRYLAMETLADHYSKKELISRVCQCKSHLNKEVALSFFGLITTNDSYVNIYQDTSLAELPEVIGDIATFGSRIDPKHVKSTMSLGAKIYDQMNEIHNA